MQHAKAKLKRHAPLLGSILVVIALIGAAVYYSMQPGKLDAFTTCLEEQGATFYGAFWCPHCNDQKRVFGRSQKLLPYVECSTPDRQNQTPECAEAGITGYPTWEFADGERATGPQTLATLAERTGCELPQS